MSVVRFHLRAPNAKRWKLGQVESNHRPSVDSTFSEAHDCAASIWHQMLSGGNWGRWNRTTDFRWIPPLAKRMVAQQAVKCWRGSTVEQLTCNQQVVGSIPIASSKSRGQTKNFADTAICLTAIFCFPPRAPFRLAGLASGLAWRWHWVRKFS